DVLDRWSDGSNRWVLIDFLADVDAGGARYALAGDGTAGAKADPMDVRTSADGVAVFTGAAAFQFDRGSAFPLSQATVDGRPVVDAGLSGLAIGIAGRTYRFRIADVRVERIGSVRTEVVVRA